MTYTATGATLDHLVALVCEARPDWDPWLVRSVLQSHASQVDGTDLAVAALRAANNPSYFRPVSIGWRGPHWHGLETTPATAQERERCDVCGKVESRCYGERPGPDDHEFAPRR